MGVSLPDWTTVPVIEASSVRAWAAGAPTTSTAATSNAQNDHQEYLRMTPTYDPGSMLEQFFESVWSSRREA